MIDTNGHPCYKFNTSAFREASMKTPFEWFLGFLIAGTIAALTVMWLPGPRNNYQLKPFQHNQLLFPKRTPLCHGVRSSQMAHWRTRAR
jgi:hypothetical protein